MGSSDPEADRHRLARHAALQVNGSGGRHHEHLRHDSQREHVAHPHRGLDGDVAEAVGAPRGGDVGDLVEAGVEGDEEQPDVDRGRWSEGEVGAGTLLHNKMERTIREAPKCHNKTDRKCLWEMPFEICFFSNNLIELNSKNKR